ncbi:MAG: hypothetical protein ACI4UY_11680 [Kiritimatiellia bacterium]
MKTKYIETCGLGLALALTLLAGCGATAAEQKDMSTKTAESSITTNDNGSVSRTFVESSVTTNGNLVTERRRETRTNMDSAGNILETSTSEYAQSYNVGDTGWKLPASKFDTDSDKPVPTDAFLGLKFGDVLNETNTVREAGEPSLLRVAFKPKKGLNGFDDYYAYITPKTHKVAKICACAKDAVEPGGSWRRHYLIEALEKRYSTWARLISYRRPYYAFDVAPDRTVTVCLAGASQDYQTVISAWDDTLVQLADKEQDELRIEARKAAKDRREQQVKDAADVF